MERKELEALNLEKETIDKVLNLHHKEIDPIKESIGVKDDEIKTLKDDAEANKTKLEELSKSADGNEELKQAFEDLKSEAEKKEAQYKSDIDRREFEKVLTDEIAKRGGKTVVKKLISYDEFKESNDRTSDISKKLDELKEAEETKVLFEALKVDERDVGGTDTGGNPKPPAKEMPSYI